MINYRMIFGPCPSCLAGKVRVKSYKPSQNAPAEFVGHIVHVDLVPFSIQTIGGNNYHLLTFDEFSGYLQAIGLKDKMSTTLEHTFDELMSHYKS